MSLSDSGYLLEIERQKSLKMAACRCSNCDPQGAAQLIRLLPQTKLSDLKSLMSSFPSQPEDESLLNIPRKSRKRKLSSNIPLACKSDDPIQMNIPMIDLTVSIIGNYELLFKKTYPTDPPYLPETLFSREDAWQIAKNYTSVSNGMFLRDILGGQTVPGLFDSIIASVNSWLRSDSYKQHQDEIEDIQISIDQEYLNTQLIEEEHEEQLRLKAVERDLKAQGIADQKRFRAEKTAETLRLKLQKQANKNKEIAHFSSTSGSL
ncbi:uncharacterized protein MELLADRAFT_109831 [Melampsora larici-populina 98AG31]|uniref:Uncharacterized protein n=1 Tax=Melampsora larici-populina (strain 98AG31 / pathotype 3-4-7) TaxID=747676 RepID=F4RXS3_MELLP|nr:uncharacterized protein MELLADRAFT_109831 [Melampsora larici-populina 98AG31]EGG02848.1 hypothetical protein MELLADRAFT_109831 [Melampsora larici-populina 98AG31]